MLLREAVQQHASDSHGTSDGRLDGYRILEDQHRRNYDEHPLHCISHGKCDRVYVRQGKVHYFIVEVVKQARKDQPTNQVKIRSVGESLFPELDERVSLDQQEERDRLRRVFRSFR